jgi:hypothetical protein
MSTISYDTLRDIADAVGGRPYADYSGRGMYGRTCVGIVLDYNAVADLSEAIRDAGAEDVLDREGRSQDSLGLGTIIYWTGVTCEDAPDEDEDEDDF